MIEFIHLNSIKIKREKRKSIIIFPNFSWIYLNLFKFFSEFSKKRIYGNN